MRPREPEDQSVVPLIQEAEIRMKQAQEQARLQVEAEAAAAESEAGSALQQASEQIPLRMELRRQEGLARIQAGIASGTGEKEELLRAAERNFERAVQAIVKAVWEGG